jgi:large conductance mechanosensitive channel
MWKEFKEFAMKSNALDLAVGVIVGAASGAVVNSLVKDILMPPLALLTGGLDFSNRFVVLRHAPGGGAFATPAEAVKAGAITWNYGSFLTVLLDFLIVAFAVFLVLKALHRLRKEAPRAPAGKACPACTLEIPPQATRCPHCTTELSTIVPLS